MNVVNEDGDKLLYEIFLIKGITLFIRIIKECKRTLNIDIHGLSSLYDASLLKISEMFSIKGTKIF